MAYIVMAYIVMAISFVEVDTAAPCASSSCSAANGLAPIAPSHSPSRRVCFFFQYLAACRRRTPRTGADLKVPKDASHRDLSDAALRFGLAPRRSPSACSEKLLKIGCPAYRGGACSALYCFRPYSSSNAAVASRRDGVCLSGGCTLFQSPTSDITVQAWII